MRLAMKIDVRHISTPGELLPSELRSIGREIAKQIRDRTRSGRDVRGVPFPEKADGSPSNLRDSGRMLRSLRARKFWPRGFTIAPSQPVQNLAARHQSGKGGMPKREWIGFSPRQIQEMTDRIVSVYLRKRDHQ